MLNEQIAALKATLPILPASKVDFASSLIAQAEKGKKPLSDKQVYWVEKLVADATAPKEPVEGVKVAVTFAGVLHLFATATANGLKRPKIRLALPDMTKVKLALAPKEGKNAGFVYVSLDGEYCGKISPAGELFPFQLNDAAKADLLALLSALAEDPAGVALDFGKLTSTCCFCAKELTTDASVTAGYGPDCADRYGLPWGDAK